MRKISLLLILAFILSGCATTASLIDKDGNYIDFNKNTKYRIIEKNEGRFKLSVVYSAYQFVPDVGELIIATKSTFYHIARDISIRDSTGKGEVQIDDKAFLVSTGRNILSGVTYVRLDNWVYRAGRYGKGGPSTAEPATGTGFAISSEGIIVTAFHVVQNASKIEVKFGEGDWVEAKRIRHSEFNDIAVLQINKQINSYLQFAKNDLKLGDKVYTVGFPVIDILGEEPKYTEGNISALSGIQGEDSLLQISVPVQPGNSGGPLLNEKGEVVGMVTSSAAVAYFLKKTGTLPQNINWAVKSKYIETLLTKGNPAEPKVNKHFSIESVKKSVCLIKSQ